MRGAGLPVSIEPLRSVQEQKLHNIETKQNIDVKNLLEKQLIDHDIANNFK